MNHSAVCVVIGLLGTCVPIVAQGKLTKAPDARLKSWTTLDGTQRKELPLDAKLDPRESFALTLSLSGSGYVYVIRTSAVGDSERLYPRAGAPDRLARPGTLKLPDPGEWLRFKSYSRGDQACVLLADHPLTAAEQHCPGPLDFRGESEKPPDPPPSTSRSATGSPQAPPPPPEAPRAPAKGPQHIKVLRLAVQEPSSAGTAAGTAR